MKKIFSNKKMILMILIIILTIILLSNYIKTAEISLFKFFDKQTNSKESLFFKNQENKSALTEKAKNEDKDNNNKDNDNDKDKDKNNDKNNDKDKNNKNTAKVYKNDKIESIALISEIKDPFNQKDNQSLNKSYSQDLLFLEKNIIAEKLDHPAKSGAEVLKKNDKNAAEKNFVQKENDKLNKNIELPFKLLGIIKSKDNSAALFLYQGQNISRKEDEKIDRFKIEEINNKNISLTYQNKSRIIKLWEEEGNEK